MSPSCLLSSRSLFGFSRSPALIESERSKLNGASISSEVCLPMSNWRKTCSNHTSLKKQTKLKQNKTNSKWQSVVLMDSASHLANHVATRWLKISSCTLCPHAPHLPYASTLVWAVAVANCHFSILCHLSSFLFTSCLTGTGETPANLPYMQLSSISLNKFTLFSPHSCL